MTQQEQAEILRNRDTLSIVGTGVIAFGAWSLVRTILAFTLANPNELAEYGSDSSTSSMAIAITVFIVLFDLALRVYVGLSARAEGKGVRKGSFYRVCAVLLAIGAALSIVTGVVALFWLLGMEWSIDIAISSIIDFTSLVTIIQLLRAGTRLRQLEHAWE